MDITTLTKKQKTILILEEHFLNNFGILFWTEKNFSLSVIGNPYNEDLIITHIIWFDFCNIPDDINLMKDYIDTEINKYFANYWGNNDYHNRTNTN